MKCDDLKEVMEIERRSFPTPWSRGLFMQELNSPISRCWVAEGIRGPFADRVVGYMCVWTAGGEMHVMNLATHPCLRRSGIAKALLRRVLEEASSAGIEKVVLEVRQSNIAAQNLYRSYGFVHGGVRRRYYEDTGEDALVMILSMAGGKGD